MPHMKSLALTALALPAKILFPPVCAGCRRQVSQPGALCGACWPKLRFLEKPWCAVMGTPFSHDMGEGFLSAEAIANPPPFERARAAVAYTGVARQMVQGLKYADRTDLAPWMARWMLRAGAELVADADVVLPVPLHWRRFFSRRFNQSAELARTIAALSRKPFAPTAIRRVKVTRQQVGLGLQRARGQCARRLRRAAGAGHRGRAAGGCWWSTTSIRPGRRCSSVAKALKKSGARAVDVLTFARVLPGDFRPDDLTLYRSKGQAS